MPPHPTALPPTESCDALIKACRNVSRVTSESPDLTTCAPQAAHFTDRQSATRGSGEPHCGQVKAIQAIRFPFQFSDGLLVIYGLVNERVPPAKCCRKTACHRRLNSASDLLVADHARLAYLKQYCSLQVKPGCRQFSFLLSIPVPLGVLVAPGSGKVSLFNHPRFRGYCDGLIQPSLCPSRIWEFA